MLMWWSDIAVLLKCVCVCVCVCTTYFNVKKLRILTTECSYFRIILTLKSGHFINAINRLVFVMETQGVYCEIRTEFFIYHFNKI